MRATDPQGRTYSVTRRWVPWRRRIREVDATGPDLLPDVGSLGDDPLSAVLLVVFGLAALVVVLPGVLLLLGAAVEVALLLALLPLAVLARTLAGVPWEVEVRRTGRGRGGLAWPVVHAEPAGGWSQSRTRIHELVHELEQGTFAARPPGHLVVTRDHLRPEETLRGDDPVREVPLALPTHGVRVAQVVEALGARGPVVATLRDTPTAWVLREGGADGPRGRALATVDSHSGYGSSLVTPLVDPRTRLDRDVRLHLDRIAPDEVEAVVVRERHRNGWSG